MCIDIIDMCTDMRRPLLIHMSLLMVYLHVCTRFGLQICRLSNGIVDDVGLRLS